jgi:hypothetical protein
MEGTVAWRLRPASAPLQTLTVRGQWGGGLWPYARSRARSGTRQDGRTAERARGCAQALCRDLHGNPHSQAAGGGGEDAGGEDAGGDAVAEARAATLALCNAPPEDYVCVFTSGATGAGPCALRGLAACPAPARCRCRAGVGPNVLIGYCAA